MFSSLHFDEFPVFFSEQNISLLSAGTLGAEPCPKGYHSIVKKRGVYEDAFASLRFQVLAVVESQSACLSQSEMLAR